MRVVRPYTETLAGTIADELDASQLESESTGERTAELGPSGGTGDCVVSPSFCRP